MAVAGGPGQLVAPVVSGVTIGGSPDVGSTIMAAVSVAVGWPTPVVTFQWSRDDGAISGATGVNYVVAAGDAGHSLVVTVTATNQAGSTAVTSASVTVPIPPPQPPTTGGGGGGGVVTTPSGGGTTTTGGGVDLTVYDTGASDLTALSDTSGLELTPLSAGAHPTVGSGWDFLRATVAVGFVNLMHGLEDVAASPIDTATLVPVVEVGAEVTADIEGIGIIAFAAGLLLSEDLVGWLIDRVARLFDKISILGWHPLAWLGSGMWRVGTALQASAVYWGDKLAAVFITPIRAILGVFQRIYNALTGAHNKISTVVTSTIPASEARQLDTLKATIALQQAQLEQAAIQARANIQGVTSEAYAKTLIRDAEQYGGLTWDLTGLAAASIVAVDEYVKTVLKSNTDYVDTTAVGITTQVQRAIEDLQGQLISQLTPDELAATGIDSAVATALPSSTQLQLNESDAQRTQIAASQVTTLTSQIESLNDQVTTLQSRIARDNQTIADAQQSIATAKGQTPIDTATIDEATVTIQSARTDIAISTQQIGDLHDAIDQLETSLAKAQQGQVVDSTTLPRGGLSTGLGLATILATLTATVAAIRNKVDTCVVDNCDPANPNNIRNVLKGLLTAFTDVAEIGFIAEAIRDPLGTADALAPLLEGIDTTATRTFDALLSL